ncbi:ABC transporter B family member 15-like protein [Tanacetum coccineum]
MSKQSTETTRKVSDGSLRSLFMHADGADILLMTFGLLGAICDGLGMPAMLFVTNTIMNSIGDSSPLSTVCFQNSIIKQRKGYCWSRTADRQASRLRSTYLKAVLRQEVAYFDLNVTSTSDIITSVSSDSLIIQDVISEKVPMFVMNVATFVGAIVVALILLWRLAIVGLPFITILVIPALIYGKLLMSLSRKIREEYNKAGATAEQAISSIRTVYSFVGENKTIREYSAYLEGTVELGLKQVDWRCTMELEEKPIWSVGAGFIIGESNFFSSFGSALPNMRYFSDAMAASERIREVIKRVPKIDLENMEGEILQQVYGEFKFKNVKFAYPSRPESVIFKDFNLEVPAGRIVALVGGSGSGKSTVIALLQRFYDPQGGEISIDGVRIDKLQLKWLRSQMGLVSQEPALFATNIKENILFGKENATMEEVIEAAKASNAHNFIIQLPQAYETQVLFPSFFLLE